MKKIIHLIAVITVSMVCVNYFSSCKKTAIEESTTSDLNIYPYLVAHPDQFSEWAKIVDKSGYAGFLTAYGAYTMFAPTNDGVKLYLKDAGKASVDNITEVEAKALVAFHLMQDTIQTSLFKDGKLPTITMYGQYLVAGVENNGGVSSITINRQALITRGNVQTGNGLIHIIDHVLKPATKSSAQFISDDPELSIFKQALIATGFYDTLNNISTTDPKRFFTVIAETNKGLAAAGFTSYASLASRYSNTGNPKNPLDSLYIYVAYHIIPEAKYLADIASTNSMATLQPAEILSAKLQGETVLINDLDFNGVHEQGVTLDRTRSDVSTTTGVLHVTDGHFRAKTRIPFPVYWDVADFPEVRKLPAIFRKASQNFTYGTVKDFAWNNPANVLSYVYSTSSALPAYYNDYLLVPMGNTSRHNWIEFRTPLLVKGKYKLWICYIARKNSGNANLNTFATGGSNSQARVSFDGEPTERPFNFCVKRATGSDGELEALGWKKYSTDPADFMTGKYVGIITVKTTDRHIVRFDVLPEAGTGNPDNFLDMIHIIPVDWPSQVLPRFGRDGTVCYDYAQCPN